MCKKEDVKEKVAKRKECFQKINSCSDYWQKFLSFIGSPCIKYSYYFVNINLLNLNNKEKEDRLVLFSILDIPYSFHIMVQLCDAL